MGSKLSKTRSMISTAKRTGSTNNGSSSSGGGGNGSESTKNGCNDSSGSSGSGSNSIKSSDISSYLAACQNDPDVKIFDLKLQQHTTSLISSLSVNQQVGSFSFDSLTQVAGCFMDMNQEVVRVILECKKDVWKNKELFSLVEDYFEYSVQTLDFFTSLDQCLKRARDRQVIIQLALKRFEEEFGVVDGSVDGCDKFARTLGELKSFKESEEPFGQEFLRLFNTVYTQQVQMLHRLQVRKRKLDKKLKSVKVYRKVSNIIFGAAFVAVVICSVVAAAIAAPPVASALAAAASAPVGGAGKWVNSLWKKYERELKNERDLIFEMQLGTYMTVKDLDNIRVLVKKLEIEIEALLSNAEFALRDTDTVTVVMDEIRNKLHVFMEGIDSLTAHCDKYSREISQARTVILRSIIKYPSAPS